MIEVMEDSSCVRSGRPEPDALKPIQSALLDQAVAVLSGCYDEDSALLSHPLNTGFKPIRESLCYAALLLIRNSTQSVTDSGLLRAQQIIDAVLSRQNRNIHGASGGAFPLAWSNQKGGAVMDPESRQVVGSLLAMLLRRYRVELGSARAEAVAHAVSLALAGATKQNLNTTYQRSLRTWLEMECGDRLVGEELLIEITDQPKELVAKARFGQPQHFGFELWANALWLDSDRLHEWGRIGLADVLTDVGESLHPGMQQLLGSGLLPRVYSEGGVEWINVWLTWQAMGNNPLLPRDLANPLDAALFAFPALAAIDDELVGAAWSADWEHSKRGLVRVLDDRSISASFEDNLQIEACHAGRLSPGREPVVAAFWQCEDGIARLTCQARESHQAICDGRSVRLDAPGRCRVVISGIGSGTTRLVEDGWQLPGLRLTCRGFAIGDAQRSSDTLEMVLRPLPDRDHGLLVFSPVS
jgi:hypothetical protein